MPVEYSPQQTFQAVAEPVTGYALNQFDWSVVVPEGTQNLFANPSFEGSDLSFIYSTIATFSRVTASGLPGGNKPLYGMNVLKVIPNGTVNPGEITVMGPQITSAEKLSFSCLLLGTPGERLTVSAQFFNAPGSPPANKTIIANGRWQLVSFSAPLSSFSHQTTPNYTGLAMFIGKSTLTTNPYYVDIVQMEPKPYPTTYCDGTQPGCEWAGPPHASTSFRPPNVGGGREYRLSDLGFRVTAISGHDMPPYEAQVQPYGLVGGQQYQRTIPRPQVIILSNVIEGTTYPVTRQTKDKIIDLLSPYSSQYQDRQLLLRGKLVDNCLASAPVQIGPTLEMPARVGASDLAGINDNYNQERFALSFVSDNPPAVRMVHEEAATLDYFAILTGYAGPMTYFKPAAAQTSQYVSNLDRWQTPRRTIQLAAGMQLTAIATAPTGIPFPAVNPSPVYAAKIEAGSGVVVAMPDGASFVAAGLTSPNALAFDNNNVLYIGSNTAGAFISKYNGALSAMGTINVPNAQVRALVAVPYLSTLYAFGDFTNSGTRWGSIPFSGPTWANPTGGAGFNGIVRGAILLQNGKILIYGDFTSVDGVARNRIVIFDPVLGTFSGFAGGFSNGSVRTAVQLPNGDVVLGGTFTTTGTGLTTNFVAIYNNSQILPLGNNALSGQVNSVAYFEGLVYAAGVFPTVPDAVGKPVPSLGLVVLVGDYWTQTDLYSNFNNAVGGTFVGTGAGALYASSSTADTSAQAAAVTSVTYTGNADTYPVVLIKANANGNLGYVYSIINQATGAALYFNFHAISTNEILTLQLEATGLTLTSNIYGDVSRYIMPNSDFTGWSLARRNTVEAATVDYANPIQVLGTNLANLEIYWRTTFQGFSAASTAAYNGL